MTTSRRNAIVLVVDRLSCGYLGPYGNTWVETPATNRMACRAYVWEQAISVEPTLAGFYRQLQSGRHPLEPQPAGPLEWCASLVDQGVRAALLCDDPVVAELPFAQLFPEQIRVVSADPTCSANAPEETELAKSFAAAMEWLDRQHDPFCLWFHTRGMNGPWDAPIEFRQRFRDEEDPSAPDWVSPPQRQLGPEPDPDELLGYSHAYAGQVTLLDMCLELLWEQLEQQGLLENTLVVFTSPRGYPLGEHGGVGDAAVGLHEELLHVPLIVATPAAAMDLARRQSLAQPLDLLATLAAWFGLPPPRSDSLARDLSTPPTVDPVHGRESVVASRGTERALRTAGWLLTLTPPAPAALFAKPDDRCEINNVAGRCGRELDRLRECLDQFEQLAVAGRLDQLPRLPADLAERSE